MELDKELQRPSDIMCSKGDARKAYAELGWKSSYTMPDVVRMMVQAELSEHMPARSRAERSRIILPAVWWHSPGMSP